MRINLLLLGFLLLTMRNAAAQDSTKAKNDTASRVFRLGEVSVYTNRVGPIFNSVSAAQIQTFAKNNVAQALNLLPGITQSQVGPRNEAMIYVRGFDLRRIPILIDGIPVYVPYDGYVDLARFSTFDLSDIQVSKDYTSVNYGPNSMGGAINLITRRPVKSFELNGSSGWQSGGYRSNFNIGSNLGKFYLQAGLSKYKRNWVPLSGKFVPVPNEDGGHRDNSYSNDEKVSFKVAYTPNSRSEYALGYTYQHGTKGTPVYTGSDSLNNLSRRPRWQWPKWDKQSVYFLSNTGIDSTQFIRTRFYYDEFKNTLNSYDDAGYSTMTRPYAFSSLYNDYSFGGIVEYGKKLSRIDNIDASIQYKQDVHRENNVGEPVRRMSDGTFTAAIENQLNITRALMLLTGVSFNKRSSITAQDYNGDTDEIADFPSNSNNAVNVQGALQYNLDANNNLSFSIARKTRFATTKDRYSYSMGTALANPDLKAEYAINYDLSYKGALLNNHLKLYVSAFHNTIHNTILSVSNVAYDEEAQTSLSQLQNVGKTRGTGFELGANYQLTHAFLAGANYTFIDRKNVSNSAVYLIDVPKSKLLAYLQYGFRDIFSVQINGEYNSKRYSTSYGTVADAFTLFNGSANVHVWKWFSVETGVNNIFDRNYSLVEGFPEAGRNYFTNLIYHL
jgi:iron complex outermembrane recepter protein